MTDGVAGGLDDRRAAVLAGGLVAAAAVVLAFGSGAFTGDGAGTAARPTGRDLGTVVQPATGPGSELAVGDAVPIASSSGLVGATARTPSAPPTSAAPASTTTTTVTTSTPASPTTLAPVPAAACSAGVVAPFWEHLEKGHLEASPGQQVSDALDLDRYVQTHTVLLEQMLTPIVDSLFGPGGAGGGAFWAHVEQAHLEASPAQQVEDLMDLDQYVRTHTVLVEDLLAPIVGDC